MRFGRQQIRQNVKESGAASLAGKNRRRLAIARKRFPGYARNMKRAFPAHPTHRGGPARSGPKNNPFGPEAFLPMSRADMDVLGWDELDVLLVTGDAYVDHPSFGAALLGRWLTHHGFRTGIAARPRPEVPEDVAAMGRPRLFAGATAGALDSMLAHYTAFRKKRGDDAYAPGGKAGGRPNRACIVYANLLRRAFPGLPVILGGVEASLRRVSHYDFWTDALRRSILLDAKATAILYGMAEASILDFAQRMRASETRDEEAARKAAGDIFGAVRAAGMDAIPKGVPLIELPAHEDILKSPRLLIEATRLLERQTHQNRAWAVQRCGDRAVILSPPGEGLAGEELDGLLELPFTRTAHPSYTAPVPAEAMIRESVTTHRGCAGGCSFCSLALHQGRRIRSRSRASVMKEIRRMAELPGWKGSVSDIGGPSANMWGARCAADPSVCARASCLVPKLCPSFKTDQKGFTDLLAEAASQPGVRHVRVASGWRMDLALTDKAALRAMIREFVGGQCKVAPEHISGRTLSLMRKPGFETFEAFLRVFEEESRRAGKEQYLVPYLMSAFPGCTDEDMRGLAAWLKARGWKPRQVQCFIPLPGTMAAAMYHAQEDMDGVPLFVAKSDADRLRQHAILAPQDSFAPGTARKHGGKRDDPGQKDGRAGRTNRGGGRNPRRSGKKIP